MSVITVDYCVSVVIGLCLIGIPAYYQFIWAGYDPVVAFWLSLSFTAFVVWITLEGWYP